MIRKSASYLFFILLFGLLIALFFGFKNGSFNNFLGSLKPTGPLDINKNALLAGDSNNNRSGVVANKLDLPIDPNSSYISSVYLSYNFNGSVRILDGTPGNRNIVLDGSGEGLPKFMISDKLTQILKMDASNNFVNASIDDLKVSSRVSISSTYDLKSHQWTTRAIRILN